MTSPQWIRPSVNEYERLQERLSAALKSLADAEAKLAAADLDVRRAHDSECESEFDSQVHAQTPCGCAARRAARDGREGTR